VRFTRYYSDNQIKEDEIGGACSTRGKDEKVCSILVGKPEGKRPLGRPRCRWKDNDRRNLRVGKYGLDLSGS